ncbi:Tartrate transporter [Mycena sanguinolenta]|uniref:Tartrate transporter n=1 Tax=Mycena sanguinolenta TaxID=230812 RepID=A0A8H7DLI4_9AGAR|nr:Tartrate transporter [Mycena sanguinolenta]
MNAEQMLPYSPASSINVAVDAGSPEREREERQLLRKLDIRLIPAIFVIYVMNYVNVSIALPPFLANVTLFLAIAQRTAITAARLKGLEHDLGISDIQYSVVLSILFVTLTVGQAPSNMILNKVKRPSIYIGCCVIAWGLASALSGVTTNYGGMLACRFFIGLPEASFYPGAIYLMSCWYTKKELAVRSAILYAGIDIANAFGASVAAAILTKMEGTLGIAGWRWLFIVEGSATILLGFGVMWMLPDYPRNSRCISDKESRLAQARLAEDAGEADQDTEADSTMHGFKLALADPLVWLFSIMLFSQHLGRSVGQFFPTLAKTLGYSTSKTLLLTVPPWLLAAVLSVLNAWHAGPSDPLPQLNIRQYLYPDRQDRRAIFPHLDMDLRYDGRFHNQPVHDASSMYCSHFQALIYPEGCAMTLVWASNSIPRPPAKRAAALGISNGIGNLGLLVGSYVWKKKWGPEFHPSSEICLAALAVSTVFALVIRQHLVWMNKRLEMDDAAASSATNEERVKKAAHLEGITVRQALQRRRGFRYLY